MTDWKMGDKETVGIASIGCYVPPGIITSEEISRLSGIPVEVFRDKIGMERKHVAAEDEHPSEMGVRAAEVAVTRAGIDPGRSTSSSTAARGSTTTGSGLPPPRFRQPSAPTAATPLR